MAKSSQDYSSEIDNYIKSGDSEIQAATNELKKKYDYDNRVADLDRMRRSAADSERTLSDLPANIAQRTAGRLMTTGQRARLQSSEADPLTRQLSDLSRTRDVSQQGFNSINELINNTIGDKRQSRAEMLQGLLSGRDSAFQRETAAEQKRQFDAELALRRASQAAAQRQANEQAKQQKEMADYLAKLGGGGNASADSIAGGNNAIAVARSLLANKPMSSNSKNSKVNSIYYTPGEENWGNPLLQAIGGIKDYARNARNAASQSYPDLISRLNAGRKVGGDFWSGNY